MKKFLSLITATALVLSLAACGGSGNNSSSSTSTPEGEPSVSGGVDYSIGMVTDVGGVNDQSFNQSAWEGLQALEAKGYTVSYLESKQEADYTPNLDKMADNENDLIWAVGFMMADALKDAATRNPDRNYAIVDQSFGDETPDNVTGVMFRAQEPSFLVGYIAGRMTTTNKVGYIGGVQSELIDQFEYGYKAGVAYAAHELGKEIEVVGQYANSFSDAAAGKSIALKQYDAGCDIIFHAAGNVGNGLFEAAKEKGEGFYAIGVDKDQHALAPENVLTSAMKKVGDAMQIVSEGIANGEKLGGTTATFGLAENCCGIAPTSSELVPADILADEAELEKMIVDGTIVVPATEADYNAFVENLNK